MAENADLARQLFGPPLTESGNADRITEAQQLADEAVKGLGQIASQLAHATELLGDLQHPVRGLLAIFSSKANEAVHAAEQISDYAFASPSDVEDMRQKQLDKMSEAGNGGLYGTLIRLDGESTIKRPTQSTRPFGRGTRYRPRYPRAR